MFSWIACLSRIPRCKQRCSELGNGYKVQVQVKVMLRPTVIPPVCLGIRHSSRSSDHFFPFLLIIFRQSRVCWCGAPSLTRERICGLDLLLGLANATFLRSESRGAHDHTLLSQNWDSPNLVGQVLVFIWPWNGVAQLYPQDSGLE
jgi:hypothetical protein